MGSIFGAISALEPFIVLLLLFHFCQVRAGNGHSWKGSVVSDTVKRGCPSVQSKQLNAQTGHGKVNLYDRSL